MVTRGGQMPKFRPKMTQIWILYPQVPIYRVTPNFYAVDIEEIPSGFILKVFCGYYVLSNSPNWKNFNMISTFGVIFGQKLCICHPMVPIYAVPPTVMHLMLKI